KKRGVDGGARDKKVRRKKWGGVGGKHRLMRAGKKGMGEKEEGERGKRNRRSRGEGGRKRRKKTKGRINKGKEKGGGGKRGGKV
ncbi:hypothetical protein, partial [Cronobacter sakazakii]|uniref:hypothetical protein n=1 Tax=Cronobacter sakazakii TaxID=28141 RepID=UPI001BD1B0CC